jgi:hypothetical protein
MNDEGLILYEHRLDWHHPDFTRAPWIKAFQAGKWHTVPDYHEDYRRAARIQERKDYKRYKTKRKRLNGMTVYRNGTYHERPELKETQLESDWIKVKHRRVDKHERDFATEMIERLQTNSMFRNLDGFKINLQSKPEREIYKQLELKIGVAVELVKKFIPEEPVYEITNLSRDGLAFCENLNLQQKIESKETDLEDHIKLNRPNLFQIKKLRRIAY